MSYAKFPKIYFQFIIIAFIFLFATLSFSQIKLKTTFTEREINDFIIEVFQDQATHLVFNPRSKRMKLITNFFNKQFSIEYNPQYFGKKFKKISDLGLNNKYNKSLVLDRNYNPRTFNPLKYKFPLSSKSKEMFRVGNTNYIITIKTLN